MNKPADNNKNIFLTGVIRAIEARRLTRDMINQLVKSDSIFSAQDILKNSFYSQFFRESDRPDDFDGMIEWRRSAMLDLIDRYTGRGNTGALLRLGYDYHNIRVLLKNRIFDINNLENLVEHGTIGREEIIGIFGDENYDYLPEEMEKAVKSTVELYYSTKKHMIIDLSLDQFMYDHLRICCRELNSGFAEGYIKLKIDLLNIQTLMRCRGIEYDREMRGRLFMQGGDIDRKLFIDSSADAFETAAMIASNNDLTRIKAGLDQFSSNSFAVERECDNTLTDYLRSADYMIQGVEPVISFGFNIELELKIIGIIFSCLKSGLDSRWMKMRLPEVYW